MASPATGMLSDKLSTVRGPYRLAVPGPPQLMLYFHSHGSTPVPTVQTHLLANVSTLGRVVTCARRRVMTCTAYWMAAGTVCCRIPLMSGAQLSPPRGRSGRARACGPSSAAACSAGRRSEGSPGSALPAAAGGRAAPAIDMLRPSVVRVLCRVARMRPSW